MGWWVVRSVACMGGLVGGICGGLESGLEGGLFRCGRGEYCAMTSIGICILFHVRIVSLHGIASTVE